MSRSVDDVDLRSFPSDVCCSTCDGDTTLTLQLHAIHGGANAILTTNFMNFVDLIAVVEDAFGERSLTRIDVGTDSDVPQVLQVSHTI
ncbi:hypothetical protein SDC9_60952 [bioreactor metagenome]|uniref:Uncharacterized protein n=1 Tax=bioreactor metagenome TaxID=1076179 RepID=A0A644XFN0_9ZZZZ